jgi:plasmid stability protein
VRKRAVGWAQKNHGAEARRALAEVLAEEDAPGPVGLAAKVLREMAREGQDPRTIPAFAELRQVLQLLFRELWPDLRPEALETTRQSWNRDLEEVKRIRNDVAHFRTVNLDDMATLAYLQHALASAFAKTAPAGRGAGTSATGSPETKPT